MTHPRATHSDQLHGYTRVDLWGVAGWIRDPADAPSSIHHGRMEMGGEMGARRGGSVHVVTFGFATLPSLHDVDATTA